MKRNFVLLYTILLIFSSSVCLGASNLGAVDLGVVDLGAVDGVDISDTLDRSVRPEGTAPKPIKIGEYTTINLENGMTVFVVRKRGYPKFRASLTFGLPDFNIDSQSLERSILSDILTSMQQEPKFVSILEKLKREGNQFSFTENSCFVAGMKENSDVLFGYLSEFLNSSIIDSSKFEESKINHYAELKNRNSYSSSSYSLSNKRNESEELAEAREKWKQLRDSLRFTSTEYTNKPAKPDSLDLDAIVLSDVKDYFEKYINPSNTFCMIIGDFSEEEVIEISDNYFSDWKNGSKYVEDESSVEIIHNYPEKTKVFFLNLPGAEQSNITVTWPLGDAFPYADNEPLLKLLNQIFGDSYSSYLNSNLRLDKGLTYGVKCFLNIDATGGSMTVRTKVRTPQTLYALENIFYEMLRIRNQRVSEENLQMAKNGLLGDYAVSMSAINSPAILGFGMVKEKYNLPDNYLEVYPSRIDVIDADQVREAAQKYIKPYMCNIFIEGDFSKMSDEFKKLGVELSGVGSF